MKEKKKTTTVVKKPKRDLVVKEKMNVKSAGSKIKTVVTSIDGLELSDLNAEEVQNAPEADLYTLDNIETCIKRIYTHKTIHGRLIYGGFWTILACLLYALVYDTQDARENYFAISNIRSALVDTKDFKALDFSEVGNNGDFYDVIQ